MTGREVYERAIALIDEIDSETGFANTETTDSYLARTPFLLTVLQTELMTYSKTRKKHEIVSDGKAKGWQKADLPDDVLSIDDVVTESNGAYLHDPVWRTEQNGNITEFYYHGTFDGIIRVIYIPIPKPIKGLDSELTVDDSTANLMAYGLAEAFVNVEQNSFLQRIFKSKYDEQKAMALSAKPAGMVKIVDVYGGI